MLPPPIAGAPRSGPPGRTVRRFPSPAPARPRPRRRDPRGRHEAQSGERQRHEQDGGERRRGDVQLRPDQDRGLARQHIADDAAGARGQHAHAGSGQRRHAIGQGLGRAIDGIGGEPHRIEPVKRLGRPPPHRRHPDERRDPQAYRQHRAVVDPEHWRSDQQVAQRAATGAGDYREEHEGDDRQPEPRRRQRTRRREHRDAKQVQPRQRRGGQGRHRGRDHRHGLGPARPRIRRGSACRSPPLRLP